MVGIKIGTARQAVGLLEGRHSSGLTVLTAENVEISADVPRIPVGVDGESVLLPTPVRCAIRPRALRVWVPRDRPGTIPPKPTMDLTRLRRLAGPGPRTGGHVAVPS